MFAGKVTLVGVGVLTCVVMRMVHPAREYWYVTGRECCCTPCTVYGPECIYAQSLYSQAGKT
jgi:hypothetical protein